MTSYFDYFVVMPEDVDSWFPDSLIIRTICFLDRKGDDVDLVDDWCELCGESDDDVG